MMESAAGFSGESLLRGLLGLAVIVAVCYLLSFNRKRIDWKLVIIGICLQITFALAVLYVPFCGLILEKCGKVFIKMMDFSQAGIDFLLGPYAPKANGFTFLFHSLPVIVFFSALVSILYHWGIIQKMVGGIAWLLRKALHISGSEGLVVSGNIFLGMTEAPILIKNYLPSMNKSEMFLVLVSGMGTIAGSVMGTYIALLASDNPAERILFAKHLLSASVMAAPGAIVIAKMLCPQTEKVTDRLASVTPKADEKAKDKKVNVLDAVASGTFTGLKLMANIAAMLLVFISLVAMANYITDDLIGHYTGLNDWIAKVTDGKATGLTFQFVTGIVLAPFMWLIGVPAADMMTVGSLLGQKTILNEFVAYFQMQQWRDAGVFVYQKSVVMSTYLLCGFANIGSIGMLLGGIGVLAPEKRGMIARMGLYALLGGALVSILSATIIGMLP